MVWDTLVEEDKGGQERDPGEVVRWRIRFSLPTASVPLPLSNLLTHTQRCLAHIASGNGYAQTVAFCPQMDPPPIPPSPPPTSGWLGATPAAGRGGGIAVCVGRQDRFGIDIRQVGITRTRQHTGRARSGGRRGWSGGELTRRAGPSRVTTYTST